MRPWTMCMASLRHMMCLPETGSWRGHPSQHSGTVPSNMYAYFRNGGQWLLGKAMKSFAPIGPAIVTKDVIGDPNSLNLSCKVNGEFKQVDNIYRRRHSQMMFVPQNSNTAQFVFNVSDVIAWITRFTTLLPGDIILTGTPPGVGAFQKPSPQFLKVGDMVECQVEKIGKVVNKIVEDQ